MKKLILSKWLFVALAMLNVLSLSAGSLKFKAVTANVDGLPPVVNINYTIGSRDVTMNEDGSQEPGARRMGQLIAENLWDIVALSEDFNYHSYIMEGVSTYYNAATWRGLIDQSNLAGSLLNYPSATATDNKGLYMKTDGLGFLTRKKYSVSPANADEKEGNNWVPWNDHYGFTDHEADGLIRKGFRFYQVTLAPGYVVDVYITHMEAGSDPEDNAARAKQLKQFADYILAHKGNNPIIILGDTNCRYTRDPLKTAFIDAINADPDLEIHDPWVDLMWDGVYPEFGTGSIMVGAYGEQKGEVVDKVWYINNAKSANKLSCEGYLHDDSFTYADGSQIADHYPVVASMVIEGPADIPEKEGFKYPDPTEKKGVVSGQTYFLRNVGSGEFLRAGGAWTTQAVMGDYPSKVKPASKGGDKYSLQTTHDNKWLRYNGTDYYMDQDENQWTLTQLHDNVYTLTDADGNAVSHANGVVAKAASADAADPNQQWEFLTQENLIEEIYYATTESPKDVTFLMKGADFGYADQESWTSSKGSNANHGKQRPDGYEHVSFWKAYNGSGWSSSNRNWKLSQTISGLPNGTYEVTYQCLTYNLAAGGNHKFTINGEDAPWTNVGSDPGNATVAKNLAAGDYTQKKTVTVSDGKIEIVVDKSNTSSATGAYYDNFKIKCIGITGKPDIAVLDRVKQAIDDAQAKADAAGLKNYRNNKVVELWREQEINGDGWQEVKDTYKNLAEAVLAVQTIPADYTYAIVNNSFELFPDYNDGRYNIDGGYPLAWNLNTPYDKDSGVWSADDANKKVNNADGDYIYSDAGYAVKQSITLTPGIYKLSAKVASNADNNVYLYAYGVSANGNPFAQQSEKVAATGADNFETVSFNFSVTQGQPFEIGVGSVAATRTGAIPTTKGSAYKVDDFRLTRLAPEAAINGMEWLQYAIDDAKAKSKKYGEELDLSKYQDMIDNYKLMSDGRKEAAEVYSLLAKQIMAAGGDDIDLTDVIANNSFETNSLVGWTLQDKQNDTDVKPNSNATYTMSNCDGKYLFNTWNDGVGYNIYQNLAALPKGHYELKVIMACDLNQSMFLALQNENGEDVFREDFVAPEGKEVGIDRTLAFNLDEETSGLVIAVGGTNSNWYKVDNFRLYYKGLPRYCAVYKDLQKAIDYANATAAKLPEKYASQWTAAEFQAYIDEHCSDGHDHVNGAHSEKDPLNHDASEQIKAVYAKLRALVFSQTEEDADFTLAIINPGFETGDFTGWTSYTNPGADSRVVTGHSDPTFVCEGTEGEYLYNHWMWTEICEAAHPVYQVIPNVPAGIYSLSLKVASFKDNKFFIAANNKHSDIISIPELAEEEKTDVVIEEKQRFIPIELIFEIPAEDAGKDLKIGLYPTLKENSEDIAEYDFADDVLGPWYKVDDFRLRRPDDYRVIEWAMEGETNGTIIMPFDTEVPEGYIAYTISNIGEQKAIPADNAEGMEGTYQVLTLEPVTVLEAHKAYFIRKAEPEAEDDPVRFRVGEQGNLTFIGMHYEGDIATNGMLAGTYEARTAVEGEYHLNETATYFKKATANFLPEVPAHHAYIPAESGATADYLFLSEKDVPTGVDELLSDHAANADIYTTGGVLVRSQVNAAEALSGLDSGIYIIRCGNRTYKVIKK